MSNDEVGYRGRWKSIHLEYCLCLTLFLQLQEVGIQSHFKSAPILILNSSSGLTFSFQLSDMLHPSLLSSWLITRMIFIYLFMFYFSTCGWGRSQENHSIGAHVYFVCNQYVQVQECEKKFWLILKKQKQMISGNQYLNEQINKIT